MADLTDCERDGHRLKVGRCVQCGAWESLEAMDDVRQLGRAPTARTYPDPGRPTSNTTGDAG